MEATLQAVGTFLIDKGGVLGIACIILGLAVARLFDLLMKSQEKRIEDKAATEKALNETASALERLTEYLKARGRRT